MVRNIEEIVNRQIKCWNSLTSVLHYEPGDTSGGQASEVIQPAVAHPVICISRDVGSGARVIVQNLCERLGYEVFGHALIDEIARDMNVQRQLVDALDETSRNELELIIESYLKGREIDSQEYYCSLVRVIRAIALKGGLILLGRGGAFILGDQSALNVLITADVPDRIERLMGYENLDREAAEKKLHESDLRREKFARKLFKKDIHDIKTYDLVINTTRICPAAAAQLILKALEYRGYNLDTMKIASMQTHGMESY